MNMIEIEAYWEQLGCQQVNREPARASFIPFHSTQAARSGKRAGRPALYKRSVIDGHVDVIAAHLDQMDRHRLDRRHAEGLAGPDVESRTVTRALDLAAEQLAFREWPAVVGADVVDRVKGSLDVENGDSAAVHCDQFLATGRQFAPIRNLDE